MGEVVEKHFTQYGERIAKLETSMEYLARELGENKEAMQALTSQLGELTAALNRGRGGIWALASFGSALLGIGFLIGKYFPALREIL